MIDNASKILNPLLKQFIKGCSRVVVVEIVDATQRPLVETTVGYYGELLVLYMNSIGISNVWMGGSKIWFSMSEI